jgi:hypothetical protein
MPSTQGINDLQEAAAEQRQMWTDLAVIGNLWASMLSLCSQVQACHSHATSLLYLATLT